MHVLRERIAWRRPIPEAPPRKSDLSGVECVRVRAAIRFLARRYDGRETFAMALGVSLPTLARAMRDGSRPSAATAMRVAIVAGVNPAEVLDGRWPPAGACPLCGHVTGTP